MPRQFTNANADTVIVTAQGFTQFEYGTMAAVYYQTVAFDNATGRTMLTLGSEAQDYAELFFGNNGTGGTNQDKVGYWNGAASIKGTTAAADNTWMLVAASKNTGTVQERAHLMNFSVGTWTHETTGTAAGDNAGTGATTHQVGYTGGPTGYIMAVAAWRRRVLSDSEVERLARGMWSMFDPDLYMCFPSGRDFPNRTTVEASRNRMLQSALGGTTVSRGNIAGPPGFRTEPLFRRR